MRRFLIGLGLLLPAGGGYGLAVDRGIVEPSAFLLEAVTRAVAPTPAQAMATSQSAEGVSSRPAQAFRDCAECPEMVVVQKGSFTMGSPKSEHGREDDEDPPHEARISSDFAVGTYEVTFAEWDACVADGGCGGYRPSDQGWGRGNRPVINVSWDDAKAYVTWLSSKTGKPYRLLSEAEWEYAARAGTTAPYPWGRAASHKYANYGEDECCGGLATGQDQWVNASPVGSFPANAFGLHDMHGNVWEWVEDCYHDSYDGAPSDGRAWIGGDCGSRVLRGGSWTFDPGVLRSANRMSGFSGFRNFDLGFRVARAL